MKFNKYFDHTLLKADATENDIRKLCEEAIEFDFYSVCVNSYYVKAAHNIIDSLHRASLSSSKAKVKVAAVVGFPLGAMTSEAKLFETNAALDSGASEIDMVINIGALKDAKYSYIHDEIRAISRVCQEKGALLKVILETCLLTDDEIVKGCEISVSAGADFVKTSTGFSTGGATESAIKLMHNAVAGKAKIKASGGIRTLQDALKFIELGADRLGCSASVKILGDYNKSL